MTVRLHLYDAFMIIDDLLLILLKIFKIQYVIDCSFYDDFLCLIFQFVILHAIVTNSGSVTSKNYRTSPISTPNSAQNPAISSTTDKIYP